MPAAALADAGGLAEATPSLINVHEKLTPCTDLCTAPAESLTARNFQQCCVACVDVASDVARKARGYVDNLFLYRWIAAFAFTLLGAAAILLLGSRLSYHRKYRWIFYVAGSAGILAILVALELGGEFAATRGRVGDLLGADQELRTMTAEDVIPSGSTKCSNVSCFKMIGEYGTLEGDCSELGLTAYPGAFRAFRPEQVDPSTRTEQIKLRAEDSRRLLQGENVTLDVNRTPRTPNQVWDDNNLLEPLAMTRMGILRRDIVVPAFIVIVSPILAWLGALAHSTRRRRQHLLRLKGLHGTAT